MKERNDNIPLGDKTMLGLGIYGMDVRTQTSWSACSAWTACAGQSVMRPSHAPTSFVIRSNVWRLQQERLICKMGPMDSPTQRLRLRSPALHVKLHRHDGQLPCPAPWEVADCILFRQVYSLHTSMDAVVKFLEKVDPERAKKAKQRYSCFDKCALRCRTSTARPSMQQSRDSGSAMCCLVGCVVLMTVQLSHDPTTDICSAVMWCMRDDLAKYELINLITGLATTPSTMHGDLPAACPAARTRPSTCWSTCARSMRSTVRRSLACWDRSSPLRCGHGVIACRCGFSCHAHAWTMAS